MTVYRKFSRVLPRSGALAVMAFALAGQLAHAVPIEVTTAEASWHSVTRGANLEFIDSDGITGAEELRWGGDVKTKQKSGYLYTAEDAEYDIDNWVAVTLGYFTHINQTIKAGTSIRAVGLSLVAQIAVPGFAPVGVPIEVSFRHRETTNDCNSSPDCANDLVTLTLSPVSPIIIGNASYMFEEVGFMLDDSVLSAFSTVEETDNLAPLVARLTRTAVPEPGTGLLLAAGMGLLLRRNRRSALAARG